MERRFCSSVAVTFLIRTFGRAVLSTSFLHVKLGIFRHFYIPFSSKVDIMKALCVKRGKYAALQIAVLSSLWDLGSVSGICDCSRKSWKKQWRS